MDTDRGLPDLDAMYRDVVLDHFRNPRGRQPLPDRTACNEGQNPVCGDHCRLCLKVDGGTIAGVEVQGRGCAISTASGSMMAALLPGRTLSEATRLLEAFKGVMHGQPPPPGLDLGDLDALEGVRQFPVRVKCALLAWTTLEGLLKILPAQASAAPASREGEGDARSSGPPSPAGHDPDPQAGLADRRGGGAAAAAPASRPAPRADAAAPPSPETVLEAVKPVTDPEIGLGVVDLGLVYGVDVDAATGRVVVRLTLTTPACPYGPSLLRQIEEAVRGVPGVTDVKVELVWDPPWDPKTMASDLAKDVLGLW